MLQVLTASAIDNKYGKSKMTKFANFVSILEPMVPVPPAPPHNFRDGFVQNVSTTGSRKIVGGCGGA